MSTRSTIGNSGQVHAVRFYHQSDDLCRMVADFLAEGLADGEPAIVIATPEHRHGIGADLASRGLDVDRLTERGELTVLDARDVLAQIMSGALPDAVRFQRALTPVIDAANGGHGERAVRAYGEMVDVLWKAGRPTAATRLESLWNALSETRRFSLLCGYAVENVYENAAVREICSLHSHIVSETGDATRAH